MCHEKPKEKPFSSLFSVHSFLGGTDQQAGQVTTVIVNRQTIAQEALYFHMIPWFLHIYLHTVKLRCVSFADHKVNSCFFLLSTVAYKVVLTSIVREIFVVVEDLGHCWSS